MWCCGRAASTPRCFIRAMSISACREPVFLCVGRVAVEKNLEAFLDLDLPGTKLIVGDGPARAALERKYPDAVFLGARHGEELASIYAGADVFVFPSKTDTFGLVLLEALASGLPVAAFPVTGPRDVIGTSGRRASDDLRSACLEALGIRGGPASHLRQATPGRHPRASSPSTRAMSASPPETRRSRKWPNSWRKTRISRPPHAKASCPPNRPRDTTAI